MRTNRDATRKLGSVVVVAAVLAVAGCGGDGQDANGGAGAASPLQKYLGYSPFDTTNGGASQLMFGGTSGGAVQLSAPAMPVAGENTEEQREQSRKVENLIATCMRQQGFEYVPYLPEESEEKTPWERAYDLPPDKFAERWGYGISTMDDLTATAPPQDDPNQKIRKQLSKSARKAYDEALHGEGNGIVILDGGESSPQRAEAGGENGREPSGCAQQSHEKVHGSDEASLQELSSFQSLFEDVGALGERLGRDPRVVEATAEWSDCMADAGHTGLDSPQDASGRIEKQMTAAMDRGAQQGSGGPPGLDKLADKEIELATADHECAQQGLDEVSAKVARDLEAEFVQDNKAELERYRDYRTEQQDGQQGPKRSGRQGDEESGD